MSTTTELNTISDELFYAVIERLKAQGSLSKDSFIREIPFFNFSSISKESQVKELFSDANEQNMYKNIASTYDSIHEVKYFQHIVLNSIISNSCITSKVKDNELSIKPYPIGNTIGACAWCISKNKRNILYLVSYNHADEK